MKFNDENNLDSDFGFLSDDVDFSIETNNHKISNENEKSNTLTNFSEKEKKSKKEETDLLNIEEPNLASSSESSFEEDVELSNVEEPNLASLSESSFEEDVELLNIEEPNLASSSESSFEEDVELSNVEEPNLASLSESSFEEDVELLNIEEPNLASSSESSFEEDVELSNVEEPNLASSSESSFEEDVELLNVEEPNLASSSKSSFEDDVELSNVEFDLPQNRSSVIKVIGVGGGGSNAVNHMYKQGIKGVDFIVCNTDAQALESSQIPTKIQLGMSLTEGLGAGENPEIGKDSAIESEQEINEILRQGTKMVFITAGMGGGTGTGAAPIIAQKAKENNILTIGIVTIPFSFEGKKRRGQAAIGVEKMKEHVDSLIIINNDKLIEIHGKLGFKTGFAKSDEILAVAAKGISEVITQKAQVNIDLSDARTVLKDSGTAIMGSAQASGKDRAKKAIREALDSPLLNLNSIKGADKVLLLLISGNDEITFDEIGEINDYIHTEAGGNVDIIMGVGEDENLTEDISVTIIATGSFGSINITQESEIIVHDLDEDVSVHNTVEGNNKLQDLNDIDVEYDSEGNMVDLDFKSKNIENQQVINEFATTENSIKDFSISSEEITKKINLISDNNEVPANVVEVKEPEIEIKEQSGNHVFNQENVAAEQIRKAQDRLERLERFNHELKDLDEQKINHFENEPAYKRSGVELDNVEDSSSKNPISRFTLEEGDSEFKESNSFLHDNVD